jgi:hypothetical protein
MEKLAAEKSKRVKEEEEEEEEEEEARLRDAEGCDDTDSLASSLSSALSSNRRAAALPAI